jgi:hypothetical protein
MRTPTEKSFNPTDLRHETWDNAGPEPQDFTDNNDPLPCSEVPAEAHDRDNVERNASAKSPYAPKMGRRGQTTADPGFAQNEDAPPLAPPQALDDLRENPAQRRHAPEIGSSHYANDAASDPRAPAMRWSRKRDDDSRMTTFEDAAEARYLVDRDAAAPLQPLHSCSQDYIGSWPPRRDEIGDLHRLEDVLPWAQSSGRLPTAAQLPPVPGLPPVDGRFNSGQRSLLSLESQRLVSPAAMVPSRDRLRWPLGILIAGICALPIAYYFTVGAAFVPSAQGPQLASVDSKTVAPSAPSQQLLRLRAQDDAAQVDDAKSLAPNEMTSQDPQTSRTASLAERGAVAMLRPAETGIQASASKQAVRALDAEEVELLTKQGEHFVEAGDLITARTLFQRAAEANDAMASTALGATYDPIVLAKLGVVGIDADVVKARFWYQKAVSLGSSDAKRRLDLLANR